MRSRLTFLQLLSGVEWVGALAGTTFMVVLLIRMLTHAGGLWRDEAAILHLVQSASFGELWSLLEFEAFPLLWYLVLRGCAGVGIHNDLPLRVVAICVSLSGVALIWWSLQVLGKTDAEELARAPKLSRDYSAVPLLSLALIGTCPDLYQFGGSLRAYGLGIVLMLWALTSLWRMMQSPTPKRAALACLAAVLSVQCVYYNALIILAICLSGMLVCFVRQQRMRALAVLGVGCVAALSLLPYLGIIRRVHNFNMVVKSDTVDPVKLTLNLVNAIDPRNSGVRWIWLAVVVLVTLVFGKHIIVRWRESWTAIHDRQLFLAVALFLGIVVQIGFLWVLSYQSSNSGWYYLTLLAFTAVVCDSFLCLQGARRSFWRMLRLGLAVVAFGLSQTLLWDATGTRLTNIDVVSDLLASDAKKGDMVVLSHWWMGISFQRYYKGAAEWETLPPISDHRAHRYDLLKEQMAQPDALAPLLRRVQQTLQDGGRVWVVGPMHFLGPGSHLETLPPAPHSPTGWKEEPYLRYWRIQLSQLIQEHGSRIKSVPIGLSQPVIFHENPQLSMCEKSP